MDRYLHKNPKMLLKFEAPKIPNIVGKADIGVFCVGI